MGSHHHCDSPQDEVALAHPAAPSGIEAGQIPPIDVPSKSPLQLAAESVSGRHSSASTPTNSTPNASSSSSGPAAYKEKIRIDTRSHNQRPLYTANQQSTAHLRDEQAYLLATLPGQTHRAASYLNLLSDLQEKLRSGEVPSDQRRKTKKKVSMTRKKIAEASEQQKVILGRLGEIFVELQNREQWAQLMGGPMSAVPDWYYSDSPMTPWTGTISTPSDMTPMMSPPPLDATSPEFIPMGYFVFPPAGPYPQVYCRNWGTQLTGMEQAPFSASTSPFTTETWGGEDPKASQPSKSDYDALESSTMQGPRDDVGDLEEVVPHSPYDTRRMSVPCVKSAWPEDENEEKEDKNDVNSAASTRDWDEHEDERDGDDVEIILDHR